MEGKKQKETEGNRRKQDNALAAISKKNYILL
jgi:hypothetical protein